MFALCLGCVKTRIQTIKGLKSVTGRTLSPIGFLILHQRLLT